MKQDAKTTPSHVEGHRARLRQKILTQDVSKMEGYEILECLLTFSIPRKDVKPLAKELIDRFGSIGDVLNAKPENLLKIKGVKETTAALFRTIYGAQLQILKRDLDSRPILNNWDKLMDYCYATIGREDKESLHIFYLDSKLHLVLDDKMQEGTVDHTAIYPREVIQKALDVGANSFIMIHNHPSGDCRPSEADREMTVKIAKVAASLNIVLYDHLIISRAGALSLRDLGYLGPHERGKK